MKALLYVVTLFCILLGFLFFVYKGSREISAVHNADGMIEATVSAKRNSWNLEGFTVFITFKNRQKEHLGSYTQAIDHVDIFSDAVKAYSNPVWEDKHIVFKPASEAVDVPKLVLIPDNMKSESDN